MKVIIIAAGAATRLGKITQELPKGLLEINGKTIIQRQIELFKKNNVDDITIITGQHENFGITDVSYIRDKYFAEHDVLGSLMAAKDQINGQVITSYSDIIFEESILCQALDFSGDIGILVDLNWKKSYEGRTEHPKSEADNVLIDNGKILSIQKGLESSLKNQVIGEFLGIMIFSEKGSKIFVENYLKLQESERKPFHKSPSVKQAYLTDMLQELIDLGYNIEPVISNGEWCEIDTPQDLIKAKQKF